MNIFLTILLCFFVSILVFCIGVGILYYRFKSYISMFNKDNWNDFWNCPQDFVDSSDSLDIVNEEKI